MNEKSLDHDGELLDRLLTEMLQTERSAVEHTLKEADRLGQASPAAPLRAVYDHAALGLPQLKALARDEGHSVGETLGQALSSLRDGLIDRLVTEEKSYRGTLLGLHHGIGCAILTRAVAGTVHRFDLVEYFDRWLAERRPLVDRCEREIPWFATHVDVATS
jgi:hypothetical protein